MITYKLMHEYHFQDMLDIFKLHHKEAGLPFLLDDYALTRYLEEYVTAPNKVAFVALNEEEEAIGCIAGVFTPSIYDGKTIVAWQTHWFVKEEWRGKGAGMQLYKLFAEYAREKGAKFHIVQVRKFSSSFAKRHDFKFLEQFLVKEI